MLRWRKRKEEKIEAAFSDTRTKKVYRKINESCIVSDELTII